MSIPFTITQPRTLRDLYQGGRTGTIKGLTIGGVSDLLGVKATRVKAGEGDGKVTVKWHFLVDGVPCQVWDYKGSLKHHGELSFGGPPVLGHVVFGEVFSR